MFEAHIMSVIGCSVYDAIAAIISIIITPLTECYRRWCYSCFFFQTKLIFKHYDLNVRISILPKIKYTFLEAGEKKGEKGAELLCKQINSHVFFRFRFFSVLFCGFALWIDLCEEFAYIIIIIIIISLLKVCAQCAICAYLWYKKNANRCVRNNRCYDRNRFVYGGQWRWTASFALCAHTQSPNVCWSFNRSCVRSCARLHVIVREIRRY